MFPDGEQCPTITRTLSQNFASVGAVTSEIFRDSSLKTLKQTQRVFTSNNQMLPYTSLPTQLVEFHYETPHPDQSQERRATQTLLQYNDFGNVEKAVDYGRFDVTGDEFTTYTNFYPNLTSYIVSKKAIEARYAGLPDIEGGPTGPLLSRIEYLYDDHPAVNVPPSRGELSSRRTKIDAVHYAVEEFEDELPWGNLSKVTDPMGHATITYYDLDLHLYPIQQKNALNQSTYTSWNFPCGQPETETDLNGLEKANTYDVHCRLTRWERPGDAFEAHEYLNFGNPALQRVSTKRPHPNDVASATIDSFDYFDGLGRIWQNTKGPSSLPIRVLRGFDLHGNVLGTTHPFYFGQQYYTTSFGYDPVDRLTRQTNPDGTQKTFVYDIDTRPHVPWTGAGPATAPIPLTKVTTTDELIAPPWSSSDAGGRPIELTRYLGPAQPTRQSRRGNTIFWGGSLA